MRRYVFPLETVLRLRRAQEDLARGDYLLARQERERGEEVVAGLEGQQRRTADQVREAAAEGKTDLLASLGAFLSCLKDRRRQARDRLGRLAEAERERQACLADSALRRKVVENLRERRERDFRRDEERRERRGDDEVATARYARRAD